MQPDSLIKCKLKESSVRPTGRGRAKFWIVVLSLVACFVQGPTNVYSDDSDVEKGADVIEAEVGDEGVEESDNNAVSGTPPPKNRRGRPDPKEMGTRALDRNEFPTIQVIRSQYRVNGVQLEVDSD